MKTGDSQTYPLLRPVEIFPIQAEGKRIICLRDPEGLAEQPVFLNEPQAIIVSQFDGGHSLRDIQESFFRATSEILPIEAIGRLVEALDQCHYLDSEGFRSFRDSLVEEYRNEEVRRPRHAGAAYRDEPEALKEQLDACFTHPDGPAPIPPSGSGAPLRGLIAPHIDFERGGPTYGHAYRALAARGRADRYIIFGTCHNGMRKRFALTEKDFATPLGPVRTDRDFLEKLSSRLAEDYYSDEFSHRAEHSIEFQTVFLRHVLENESDWKIVPILVGSFHGVEIDDVELERMSEAVRLTMEELPGRYCIIAGADLAHVGRRFGDPDGPDEAMMQTVGAEDREFLELAARGDAGGIFRSIAGCGNRRRVCGFPPIYMMLKCLGSVRKGELLQYRQWSDFQGGSAVTFAGLALF